MKPLQNLKKLAPDVRKKIACYMDSFLRLHGDNIVSIVIYGSSASGDHIPGLNDIKSAIVFRRLEFAVFKDSLRLVRKGIQQKLLPPLFLSPNQIEASTDTFPIEFLEMKENYLLIYGDDFLKSLDISPIHIRFVCEQQLKGILIRIRQAYLEIGLERRGIVKLLRESLSVLLPVCKGLLRLNGIKPPKEKNELIRLLADTFKINTSSFTSIMMNRLPIRRREKKDLEGLLADYLTQLETLAEKADRL